MPPKIDHEVEITGTCGKDLNAEFNVIGIPVPNITITKGDQPLLCNEHYQISFENEKLSLRISSIVIEDEGIYKVYAESKAGQATSSMILNVQGKS